MSFANFDIENKKSKKTVTARSLKFEQLIEDKLNTWWKLQKSYFFTSYCFLYFSGNCPMQIWT